MSRLVLVCLGALLVGAASPVAAHPVPFSFVDVHGGPDAIEVSVVAHVFDLAHDLGVQPPERLLESAVLSSRAEAIAAMIQGRLHLSGDGRPLTGGIWSAPEALPERQSIEIRGRFNISGPLGRITITTVMFPYDPVHQTFVNFYERDTVATQAILDRGRSEIEYFAGTRRGVQALAFRLVPAGIEHMILGPEHLLFLFGLLLLGGSVGQLVRVVTAFTLVQAVTLTLAAFNLVTPSLRFVEPGIALSIVYLGADNLMVRGAGTSAPGFRRRSGSSTGSDSPGRCATWICPGGRSAGRLCRSISASKSGRC